MLKAEGTLLRQHYTDSTLIFPLDIHAGLFLVIDSEERLARVHALHTWTPGGLSQELDYSFDARCLQPPGEPDDASVRCFSSGIGLRVSGNLATPNLA